MSGFKRYQSKVFWGQMEAQDVHGGLVSFPVVSPRRPEAEAREGFDERDDEEDGFGIGREENLECIPESDGTTDGENNTTVIHIEMHESPAHSASHSAELAAALSSAQQQQQQHPSLESRSFSPASRGQRSQDSGFSDSGRSDDSSTGHQSPRRQRRRRSSRRSRRSNTLPRLASLRGEEDEESRGPVHTSTPKHAEGRLLPRSAHREEVDALSRQLNFSLDGADEPDRAATPSSRHVSTESLGDFLYVAEPPEEEDDPRQSSSVTIYCETPKSRPRHVVASQGLDVRAPVKAWLEELRDDCDDECMAMLQSKSLPKRKLQPKDDEPESRDLRLLTASATTAAKKIIDAADRFDARYRHVLDTISSLKSARLERDMLQSIEAEAAEILAQLGCPLPRRVVRQDNNRNVAVQLGRLKSSVDRAFDNRLDFYIEKVVRGLEEAPREAGSTARGALAALTALGLAGPRAGASVARTSGIRALLTSLVSSGRLSSELRSASLRALASVCCCLDAVEQFVRQGGPEIVVDVLTAESTPQTEKSEAAALLVQITAPWMERMGLPYIEPFAAELVKALTDLAEATTCKQTLLLAAAGINHLSRSKRCIAPIIKCDSIKKLLRCVKKSNGGNVWLMEQVASLVGQVARVPQARTHLAETRASVALVCFLRMQPPGQEDEYRRLEATASEALTRLCVDPEIAKQVVAVGGSNCLPAVASRGGDREQGQIFQSTKSLRAARKIAAEQIDMAKIWDNSPR